MLIFINKIPEYNAPVAKNKEAYSRMWISKKKWNDLEKRVADLEKQVQSQLMIDTVELSKSIKKTIQHHATIRDNAPEPS